MSKHVYSTISEISNYKQFMHVYMHPDLGQKHENTVVSKMYTNIEGKIICTRQIYRVISNSSVTIHLPKNVFTYLPSSRADVQ